LQTLHDGVTKLFAKPFATESSYHLCGPSFGSKTEIQV
jgi:hypothetical protein